MSYPMRLPKAMLLMQLHNTLEGRSCQNRAFKNLFQNMKKLSTFHIDVGALLICACNAAHVRIGRKGGIRERIAG